MFFKHILGKRAFPLFSFFILTACSNQTREWQVYSNEGNQPHYCSSRLCLAPENQFTELELDIIHVCDENYVYLNALGLSLTADENREIPVTIKIEGYEMIFSCTLLEGGQRIKLSDDAGYLIIDSLHKNLQIEIFVEHYSTTVISDQFADHYRSCTTNHSPFFAIFQLFNFSKWFGS